MRKLIAFVILAVGAWIFWQAKSPLREIAEWSEEKKSWLILKQVEVSILPQEVDVFTFSDEEDVSNIGASGFKTPIHFVNPEGGTIKLEISDPEIFDGSFEKQTVLFYDRSNSGEEKKKILRKSITLYPNDGEYVVFWTDHELDEKSQFKFKVTDGENVCRISFPPNKGNSSESSEDNPDGGGESWYEKFTPW